MRAITWVKARGAEFAEIELGGGELRAAGVAVSGDPVPYRLEYELACGDGLLTRRLSVRAWGAGWGRRLELTRDPQEGWAVEAGSDGDPGLPGPQPGGDPSGFAAALDCDLGECPVTNTMPVLRQGLLGGGEPAEFLMAWVSVPWLAVTPSRQRYTHVRSGLQYEPGLPWPGPLSVIRYESGSFSADVTFDADGLVVDYPGLGRMA
jgi:uncharacterized protein